MARRGGSVEEKCASGCVSFCEIPVGGYYQGCGPQVRARLARGEPATGYEKVGGPRTGRGGEMYGGGAVEMLLKARGHGPGKRAGGGSAPYYPVKGCPCVHYYGPHDSDLARRKAINAAEQYAAWKSGARRMWRVA
jgi:hypothetical protein